MRWKIWIVVALLAALPLTGCGDDTGGTATAIGSGAATLEAQVLDTDLASLVPANAGVFVYAPSAKALVAKANRILALFGDEVAESVDLDQMLGQMTGPLQPHFDDSMPLAAAVAFPPEGQPVVTLILPMTDVEAAVAAFADNGQQAPPTRGSYVAMVMGPPAVPSTTVPAIALEMPAGDLVVRVDLAGLIEQFGDDIRTGLDQGVGEAAEAGVPGMPDLGKLLEGVKQGVGDLLDSAERFDLVLHLDDASVHFNGLLSMKDGSKLAMATPATGELAAMAAMLPVEFPVVGLFSFDMQRMMAWIQPLMDMAVESLPEADRADYQKQITAAMQLYAYVGNRMAVGYRMGADGLVAVGVMDLSDAEKYMEGWHALLDGDYVAAMGKMGIRMTRLPTTKVAGHDIEHLTMSFDAEKMGAWNPGMEAGGPEAAKMAQGMFDRLFGEGGMRVSMAIVDGRLVSVAGGDDALLTQAIQCAAGVAGPQTDDLAAAVEVAGGSPSFLVRMDLRAVIHGSFALMKEVMPPEMSEKMPEITAGEALDILLYGTHDGRFYEGGFKIELAGLADLIETFKSAMR